MFPNSNRLLILYGSQTSTAQQAAERIWRKSKALGYRGPVLAMDEYAINSLIFEHLAIFVCSTTGQGDPPDNMTKSWKFLLRKYIPSRSLYKLRFGVLALGDSSYPKYNYVGKKLFKRLLQLGANPLLDIGLCDYQHDLGHEAVMEPWIHAFFDRIPRCEIVPDDSPFIPRWAVSLHEPDNSEPSSQEDEGHSETPVQDDSDHSGSQNQDDAAHSVTPTQDDAYHSETPTQADHSETDRIADDIYFYEGCRNECNAFVLKVVSNERTTHESHFQEVRLMQFKRKDEAPIEYKPGHVFNIRPRNSREDVRDLFNIFETHNLDIRPDQILLVDQLHEGPERAAVIGGVSGGANTQSSQDDEYRFAGVEDPKIMITTSREPSARLKMFVKELRLVFPNSQRMNRGGYEMSQLIHACRANEVTDFIVVHEHRGVPDSLVICHLPYGPTASFTLSGVVMRHDIPGIGPMSEQFPHLVFHNFKSDLGLRTMSILKYLFPVPKSDSKRVITFANNDDYVCFRQHTYKKSGKDIELTEIGPRFQMKLYEIKLGTLEALAAADTEWALRPYMNTAAKRRFLSDEDGWLEGEE